MTNIKRILSEPPTGRAAGRLSLINTAAKLGALRQNEHYYTCPVDLEAISCILHNMGGAGDYGENWNIFSCYCDIGRYLEKQFNYMLSEETGLQRDLEEWSGRITEAMLHEEINAYRLSCKTCDFRYHCNGYMANNDSSKAGTGEEVSGYALEDYFTDTSEGLERGRAVRHITNDIASRYIILKNFNWLLEKTGNIHGVTQLEQIKVDLTAILTQINSVEQHGAELRNYIIDITEKVKQDEELKEKKLEVVDELFTKVDIDNLNNAPNPEKHKREIYKLIRDFSGFTSKESTLTKLLYTDAGA